MASPTERWNNIATTSSGHWNMNNFFSTCPVSLFLSFFFFNFNIGHHNTCEVISNCGSDLHFPNISDVEDVLACWSFVYILWRNTFQVFFFNFLFCIEVKVKVLVAQSCLTLCDPMDCRPPGSSVHGVLQARILEWIAILFSRGSSWPRDQIKISCIVGRFFTISATRDAQYSQLTMG